MPSLHSGFAYFAKSVTGQSRQLSVNAQMPA
jgi:hypothetical protein